MLHVFPPGLEGTLIVPVFAGLVVMALTTEWWGWEFVGVVVPGYLCSILLLQPLVAAVVVIEAVATWAVVRSTGALLSKVIYPIFGRDRFFILFVVSIGVSLLFEGFMLQAAANHLQWLWPGIASHRNELFGIGLVLVPLTANRLWRRGAAGGLVQLGLQVGMTYVIVGGLLVHFTNFSIAGFQLSYDHLALSFFSSPRAQIILLCTAALASRFNRNYGWDYHGILVPALLALALFTPLKLLTTFCEALLILIICERLVRLKALRNINLEGPRKLLLCFSVGFLLKLVLTLFMSNHYPGYQPSDFFGFGYLLPSLLAERMWLKNNVPLVIIPTTQTAVAGAALTAILVVGLGLIAPAPARSAPAHQHDEETFTPTAGKVIESPSPARALLLQKVARPVAPVPARRRHALVEAAIAINDARSGSLRQLARHLAPWGLSVVHATDRTIVRGSGWPSIQLAAAPRAVVVAPHADETLTPAAALFVAERLQADCVLPASEGEADPIVTAGALAEARGLPVVVVRGVAKLTKQDVLLFTRPDEGHPPEWLAPLSEALQARFSVQWQTDLGHARLRVFPTRLGRNIRVALLWLSPRARRALSGGSGDLDRPDILSVAKRRGVTVVHGDVVRWLAAGTGAPPESALSAAERLARTRDIAMLERRVPGGLLSIFIDAAHGVCGIAIRGAGARAIALAGDRVGRRLVVNNTDEALNGLALGYRTLVAGAGS